MELIKNENNSDSVAQPTIIQRALLEICVYGVIKENENYEDSKAFKLGKEIQKQIEKSGKQKNRIRVLWYCAKGEYSEELINEAKNWVINNAVCKYYILIEEGKTILSENLIKDALNNIKKFEDAQSKMIEMGIKYKARK